MFAIIYVMQCRILDKELIYPLFFGLSAVSCSGGRSLISITSSIYLNYFSIIIREADNMNPQLNLKEIEKLEI